MASGVAARGRQCSSFHFASKQQFNVLFNKKIPYVIAFSQFHENHHTLWKWNFLENKIYRRALGVGHQTQKSLELWQKSNFSNGFFCGDGRFDSVHHFRKKWTPLDEIDVFKGESKLFVLGSSWPREESMTIPLIPKLSEDVKEKKEFRKLMRQYVNGYSFLARIMPFSDQGLEEYYQFSRHIVRLLPVETTEMPTFIQSLVNMQSLRISTTSVGEIPLIQGQGRLEPRKILVGATTGDEDTDVLSSIIEDLNERRSLRKF